MGVSPVFPASCAPQINMAHKEHMTAFPGNTLWPGFTDRALTKPRLGHGSNRTFKGHRTSNFYNRALKKKKKKKTLTGVHLETKQRHWYILKSISVSFFQGKDTFFLSDLSLVCEAGGMFLSLKDAIIIWSLITNSAALNIYFCNSFPNDFLTFLHKG